MATQILENLRTVASRSTAAGDASFAPAVSSTPPAGRDANLVQPRIDYNMRARLYAPRQIIVSERGTIDDHIEAPGYRLSTITCIEVSDEPAWIVAYDPAPSDHPTLRLASSERSGATIYDVLGMEPWVGSPADAQPFEPPFLGTRRLTPPRRRVYREGTLGSFDDTQWPS